MYLPHLMFYGGGHLDQEKEKPYCDGCLLLPMRYDHGCLCGDTVALGCIPTKCCSDNIPLFNKWMALSKLFLLGIFFWGGLETLIKNSLWIDSVVWSIFSLWVVWDLDLTLGSNSVSAKINMYLSCWMGECYKIEVCWDTWVAGAVYWGGSGTAELLLERWGIVVGHWKHRERTHSGLRPSPIFLYIKKGKQLGSPVPYGY